MNSYSATSRSRRHVWRTRPGFLYIGLIGVLLLVTNALSQGMKTGQLLSQVPRSATIEIVLLKAPGINDAASQWEIAYEFRIISEAASEAAFFEARKQGKPGDEKRVGELIKEADVRKPLRSAENHKFVFEIPFSPEIQKQLRNQPKERVKIVPDPSTPEAIKLQREQDMKFQIFKFYSVVSIYDARLKKNISIPVSQYWDFAKYPDAKFGFTIEINDDGSCRWKTASPANSRSPALEIRKP